MSTLLIIGVWIVIIGAIVWVVRSLNRASKK